MRELLSRFLGQQDNDALATLVERDVRWFGEPVAAFFATIMMPRLPSVHFHRSCTKGCDCPTEGDGRELALWCRSTDGGTAEDNVGKAGRA